MRNLHLIISLFGFAALAACTVQPTTVGSDEAALTADQCDYFDEDGHITICHATSSTNHPFSTIRVKTQACVNAHANHAGDHVAVDGDCGPNACLADGAPCDATLGCCDGSACSEGICAPTAPPAECPCFDTADILADIARVRGVGGEPTCNACDPDAVVSTLGASCRIQFENGTTPNYLLDLVEYSSALGLYRCAHEERTFGGGLKGFGADEVRACADVIVAAEAQANLTCN